MTHPMTLREKVERALYSMDDWRRASPEYLIDNILTALASGSGDHAELARLADWHSIEARKTSSGYPKAEFHKSSSRNILALLAEIDALRDERDGMVEEVSRSQARFHAATEAERKLAEAVGIASKLSAAISWLDYPFIDNNTPEDELRSRVGFMMRDAEQPREMLSKEAERG